MSVSASLSNAMSGLAAVSRAAELVSANVANSTTEGYGRRELSLSSSNVGGGVRITGVERVVNETAIADRRLAEAEFSFYSEKSEALMAVEQVIGDPTSAFSLGSLMGQFEQDLIAAAITPSNTAGLEATVNSAIEVVRKINGISDVLHDQRKFADDSIASQVSFLNTSLANVNELNSEIRVQLTSGGDAAGLMDQRQAAIDEISSIIPIQTVAREYGQVALVTPNGTTLVDHQAATFQFEATSTITADMTLASGALSGLGLVGASSTSGTPMDAIAGGSLAAAFELRDEDIPTIQANLDAISRDLMERSAAADTSLGLGNAGLFTDGGDAFNPLLENGLASRLSVNLVVISSEGGDVTKLRDGINAVSSGPESDATILNSYLDGFSEARDLASGDFSGADSSISFMADFLTKVGQERLIADERQSYEANRVQSLRDIEQAEGVETDQEMQKLLLIERSYAANAKVIQAVDEMLQSLLGI